MSTKVEVTEPDHETDPIWYLVAARLAPEMGTTAKKNWIEGFVAALDAASAPDGHIGNLLRSTVGCSPETPVAVREPVPVKADVESIAKFLHGRLDMITADWEDQAVHDFWVDEARALMRFLP